MLNRLRRLLARTRGHSCYTCRYARAVRSVGDGQVSRLVVLCTHPASPAYNHLIPPERWCPLWEPREGPPLPRMEDTGLTP